MKNRWLIIFSLSVGASLGTIGPASAHAELSSSDPKEGANLGAAPEHLYINYTEPPTGDFEITVTDGCDRDVVRDAETQDRTLHVTLNPGQPGNWKVDYRVISGLDGHPTKGGYSFGVKGATDCDAPVAAEGPADEEADDDDGLGGAVLYVGIGILVLVTAAIVIRMRSSRTDRGGPR